MVVEGLYHVLYCTILYCTQYRDDGLVVVEGLFSSVELEEVSRQLMRRVEGREAGTRAEDLLNLHHTDPYIMGQWSPNISVSSQELQMKHWRSFHNHQKGPDEGLLLVGRVG